MKVLVCGDRNWTDTKKIKNRLNKLPLDTTIITGGARGADQIAYDIAQVFGFTNQRFLPEWYVYGKAAGPIRNRKMLDQKPDLVIAFHSNIAASKGTRDCIEQARARFIPVELIT